MWAVCHFWRAARFVFVFGGDIRELRPQVLTPPKVCELRNHLRKTMRDATNGKKPKVKTDLLSETKPAPATSNKTGTSTNTQGNATEEHS